MKMSIPIKKDEETLDAFYHGKIRIIQKSTGYRFSIEAPLLAGFIETFTEDELLELGTANGIISLLVSIKPFKSLLALEIQESLAGLACRNIELNGLQDRIKVICQDLRIFSPGRKYDVVFANPPYHEKNAGRMSESMEISIAKHEVKCNIFDVMRKTAELLHENGRAYFVFSFRRRDDFIEAVNKNGLKIKKERHILSYAGETPRLFLSECDFKSKKKSYMMPLILYNRDGRYSDEAEQFFSGRAHASFDKKT